MSTIIEQAKEKAAKLIADATTEQALRNLLPETMSDWCFFVHIHPLYGSFGSIRLEGVDGRAPTLDEILALTKVFPPKRVVKMKDVHTSFRPYQDQLEGAEEIAPFIVEYEHNEHKHRTDSYLKWWSETALGIVRVSVPLPQDLKLGYIEVTKTPFRSLECRLYPHHFDCLLSGTKRQADMCYVRWASAGYQYANRYTVFWRFYDKAPRIRDLIEQLKGDA